MKNKKKPNRTKPRWKERRLDPDWIGEAGVRFVREWLRSRLEGLDPYQPVDTRVDEDPEAFVVGVLRDVGAEHPAFGAIAAAALDLLDEARRLAPNEPPYLPRLIRMCQLVPLPQTQLWFSEEVNHVAMGKPSRWRSGRTQRDVLYAAVIQKAGSPANWGQLLNGRDFATLALMALGSTFRDRTRHLAQWWRTVDRDEGDRELDQILHAASREHASSELGQIVDHARLPADLQSAILLRLGSSGQSGIASARPQRAPTNAIVNAAWRPEFLLAEAA